jgi:hypothetical protein
VADNVPCATRELAQLGGDRAARLRA